MGSTQPFEGHKDLGPGDHSHGSNIQRDPSHRAHNHDHDRGISHSQVHQNNQVHENSHEHEQSHGDRHASSHGCHHARHGLSPGGAFRWSIALNSLLTGLQLVIGLGFGSLALVGDALHNLSDVVGLALGWGAERLSQRPPQGRFTYGFGRSTQLASLFNGALTFAAGAVVVVEALQRFLHPVAIEVAPVALAAAAGVVINLISARLFGHNHHHDLNQRAAVLHLLTDAAVSVAVLLSALLVGASGWLWLDAITAIAVGGVVMASAWGLLKEALAVSLDAVPAGIDLTSIGATLLALPGTLEVHSLHVWGISSSRSALTARLLRLEQTPYDGNAVLQLAQERLNALGVDQVTLQVETVEWGWVNPESGIPD